MSLPYNQELKTILERRFHENLLDGYYGGVFNQDGDKLYALTWVKLSYVDYEIYEWHHEQLSGYSSSHHDYEKTKKMVDLNSWQSKTVNECIDEGIYKYFSISFIGICFEGEWFIVPSLAFYGDQLTEPELKMYKERGIITGNIWKDTLFYPEKVYQLAGYEKAELLPTSIEFKDQPWMVSIIKQQKKERVNMAYVRYINEEFLEPFFSKLKISDPENYREAAQLRYGYSMIFPQHKKNTLFCAHIKNRQDKWRLQYFLLENQSRRFYKWTFFNNPVECDFSFAYGDLIIDDLKQISSWNQEGYLDSSCTMDNEIFWDEFVFKLSTDNVYLYLKEVTIN
ncbi:hypothetical protein ACEN9X_08430 [Mucilaginibacter sp. Mucisp86]|uniref:hypothetical protein n=1 Tax=Mucilaginibacter sp. Mucisp86 TaxID=3243060 RepID=UPI0039B4EDCC